MDFCSDDDSAPTRRVCVVYTLIVYDYASRRKIGRRYVLHHLFESDVFVFDIRDYTVDSFAQVVRRYICRKTYGYAVCAVDEKIRHSRRQKLRLFERVVEVERHRYGVFVEVSEHFERKRRHSRFGISHCRRAVAVHASEVTVTVNKQHSRIERLSEFYHRAVYRAVAVRVILTQTVTDDTRRFTVRLVRRSAQLEHRVEYSSLHGLETVLYSRQCSVENNVFAVRQHRIVQYLFECTVDNLGIVHRFFCFFVLCHIYPYFDIGFDIRCA